MLRTWIRALPVLAVLLAGEARAGLIVEGLPTSYTPGDRLSFTIKMTGVTGLNLFNIDLILESDRGQAG